MNYEENNRYVHDYEDNGQPIPSTKIGYDNTDSGLDSTNVQGAIDEVAQILNTKQDKAYDGSESGIEADTVTGAIDELAQDVSDLTDIAESLDNEKQDKAYDNTTSGLTATTIDGAIDEIVSILGDYQFIGKEAIEIIIEGTVTNFVANYSAKLKEFLDAQDEDIYYMPYSFGVESRTGTTQVTSFGGNNVKQDPPYKLIHNGMNVSSLNIDAESTVLYGAGTKMRYRKIVTSETAGHVVFMDFDSTTTPPSFTLTSHDNDACDNVKSNLYCLKFKKVK